MNNQNEYDYIKLKSALDMAFVYHVNQYREDGSFYVLHPIAVMSKLPIELPISAKITALLHDVIEDAITLDESVARSENIKKHFGTQVNNFVHVLSRKRKDSNIRFDEKEPYSDYIARIKQYPDAIPKFVKFADLEHNISTLHNIRDKERQTKLATRYYMAFEYMKDHITFETLQQIC